MGDIYQHPVFFEYGGPLGKEQAERIETYFRVKQKSGGGDCGALERVIDRTHRVLFKYQEDQQAVLQRSEHVVDGLVFSVRGSPEPLTSPRDQGCAAAPLQALMCVQEDSQTNTFTKDVPQPDHVLTPWRIVLLGKTGFGKSDLANTIFEEKSLFKTNHSALSGTQECQAETKSVDGRSITLIDTPGLFDTGRNEEELKPAIVECITECAPGPHAFLIVLKVEKFTKQEQAVIADICRYFSPEVLKYAVIVFTHGDQLSDGQTIEEYFRDSEDLRDLMEKCGGRYHVVDNKYWNDNRQDENRNNRVQVKKLLKTIDELVAGNNGGHYTNEMLQLVEEQIKAEEEDIKNNNPGDMPPDEIRKQAKKRVSNRFLIKLVGTTTGVVLGAFLGLAAMVQGAVTVLGYVEGFQKAVERVQGMETVMIAGGIGGAAMIAGGGAAAAGGGDAAAGGGAATAGMVLGVICATTGGVLGGYLGNEVAEDADTLLQAAEMAKDAVLKRASNMKPFG